MMDCLLVTCSEVENLDPDDRLLAEELAKRGVSVGSAVWSDPTVDWSSSKLCILRSTWDYHRRFQEFSEWLGLISAVTTVWNPPELVRWNADKRYLRELEATGVRTVPTVWARRGNPFSLQECRERDGFRNLVIKPAKGAATHDVMLVSQNDSLAAGQAHLDQLLEEQDVLVQPYLDSVASYGERALVFIQSRYSHAIIKKPFDRVLAVRAMTTPVAQATPSEIDLATLALSCIPLQPVYARVDLLCDASGEPCVSEVELIEPALYFGACLHAVTALADTVERHLDSVRILEKSFPLESAAN